MPNATRDQKLAFTWHAIEASTVCFLGLLSIIGLAWSWRHLGKTSTEISRERANREYDHKNGIR